MLGVRCLGCYMKKHNKFRNDNAWLDQLYIPSSYAYIPTFEKFVITELQYFSSALVKNSIGYLSIYLTTSNNFMSIPN